MPIEFGVDRKPSAKLCREISALVPENPFYTVEYIDAKRTSGFQPWILSLSERGRVICGCPAFLKTGLLTRSLKIESMPMIPDTRLFWSELQKLCAEARISELDVNTAASNCAGIPQLPGELWRVSRCEFVLDLKGSDLLRGLRNSHRGRVNRSRKSGVSLRQARGPRAWREHAHAVCSSMDRRRARGESFWAVEQTQFCEALIHNGQGELFQACLGGKVLSSAFIVTSRRGAYYFWAGTTKEGMALGASHFLVFEIAKTMQGRSLDVFNLGGTDLQNRGLIEFKRGFGARELRLEAAGFCLGSKLKRKLGRAVGLLVHDPGRLLKRLMPALGS